MSDANFVQEVREDLSANLTCHVCGAVMVAMGTCDTLSGLPHQAQDASTRWTAKCRNWKRKFWKCQSCGTTTEPS